MAAQLEPVSVVIQRLKMGQDELRRNIRALKSQLKGREGTSGATNGAKKRHRDASPLISTKHLPKKRARLVQLSPEHHHIRRLSSTPKHGSSHMHTLSSPPVADLSLEEAILDSHGTSHQRSRTASHRARSTRKRTGQGTHRGLSVSFVDGRGREGSPLQEGGTTSFMEEQDRGRALVDSLNASRFGALSSQFRQQQLSSSRSRQQRHRCPRMSRCAGGGGPGLGLGYDWIAGLVDAEEGLGSLDQCDNRFFEELKEFRRVNRSECYQQRCLPSGSPVVSASPSPPQPSSPVVHKTCLPTTCVSSYVLNERLFPVPVHRKEPATDCPVCQDRYKMEESKSSGPSRYIRISVPRSSLQVPFRVHPHRRKSFDPTDSMGLSQHCLAGWESAQPSIVPPQRNISLSSSTAHARSIPPPPPTPALVPPSHTTLRHMTSDLSTATNTLLQTSPAKPRPPLALGASMRLRPLASPTTGLAPPPHRAGARERSRELLNSSRSMEYSLRSQRSRPQWDGANNRKRKYKLK